MATYSVTEFGAVGDGITDDTAAFQETLDAVGVLHHHNRFVDLNYQNGGGKVYIPSGKYLIKKSLQVNPSTIVEGDGTASCIVFRPEIDNASLFVSSDNCIYLTFRSENVTIRNLAMAGDLYDGVNPNEPGNQLCNSAILFRDNTYFTVVENCAIQHFRRGITYEYPSFYNKIDHVMFYNIGVFAVDYGLVCDVDNGPLTIINCDIAYGLEFAHLIMQPEYAIKCSGQIRFINVGVEEIGKFSSENPARRNGPSLGAVYFQGIYSTISATGCRIENTQDAPAFVFDRTYVPSTTFDFNGISCTGSLVQYLNWSYSEAGEGSSGFLPERRFPPLKCYGNPNRVVLPVTFAYYGENSVTGNWGPFDMSRGGWGFKVSQVLHATDFDTSVRLNNSGCIRMVHRNDATGWDHFGNTISSQHLKNHNGKRIYAVAIVKKVSFEAEYDYWELELFQQSQFTKIGTKKIDFGDGWYLFVCDILIDDNYDLTFQLATRVIDEIGIHGSLQTYIAHFGLYTDGYPMQQYCECESKLSGSVKPDDIDTGWQVHGPFEVGDIIYNTVPNSNSIAWVCNVGGNGSNATWITLGQ